MGLDLEELRKDIAPLITEALEGIKNDSAEDFQEIEAAIKVAFMDVVKDIGQGLSIKEIGEKYDTKTKALLAASFFKLSEQQTKAIERAKSVLEGIGKILLRTLIISITGA